MDEHSILLPAADGMTADERTDELIEHMSAWSFAWDTDENLVMLVEDE